MLGIGDGKKIFVYLASILPIHLLVPSLTSRDICTCTWNKPGTDKPVILISAYWDGLKPEIPTMLAAAIDYANTKQYTYILCIDANAHSTTWGSPNDNVRGKKFEEFMVDNHMEIQNKGNQRTFQTMRGNRLLQTISDPLERRQLGNHCYLKMKIATKVLKNQSSDVRESSWAIRLYTFRKSSDLETII